MRKPKLNHQGQGLVEYLIIVALVAVASIGLIRALSHNVKVQFGKITNEIGGEPRSSFKTEIVKGEDVEKPTLKNFDHYED